MNIRVAIWVGNFGIPKSYFEYFSTCKKVSWISEKREGEGLKSENAHQLIIFAIRVIENPYIHMDRSQNWLHIVIMRILGTNTENNILETRKILILPRLENLWKERQKDPANSYMKNTFKKFVKKWIWEQIKEKYKNVKV